ncbi:MAG: hypothetical protein R3F43_29330 [bacterium]
MLRFHPLLVGGNPFSTTSIYTLIAFLERKWGAPPHGRHRRAGQGLVGLIEGQGGQVRTGSRRGPDRDSRAPRDRRDPGERRGARRRRVVVSNADSTPPPLPRAPGRASAGPTRRSRTRATHMSLVVWYFGTDRKYEDVAHHTILLGPRYRGLLDDIFRRKILADDFSRSTARPTAAIPPSRLRAATRSTMLSPVPPPGQRHRLGGHRRGLRTRSPRTWSARSCPVCGPCGVEPPGHAQTFLERFSRP